MIVPIEGGRWMVSLGGSRGGEPPKDPDGFVEYALALPHPVVGQLIVGAEPLTEVFTGRSTSNARRYLEKAPAWPDGLVVLGDALATFNPVYGQGMSVAALGARVLARNVHRRWGGPGLARRIQRELAKPVERAWTLAVGSDVLYPPSAPGRSQRPVAAAAVGSAVDAGRTRDPGRPRPRRKVRRGSGRAVAAGAAGGRPPGLGRLPRAHRPPSTRRRP